MTGFKEARRRVKGLSKADAPGRLGIGRGLFRLVHVRMLVPPRERDGGIDQPRGGVRSDSEPAGVAVMKPANLGEGYDVAHLGRLNRTRIRTVVVQRPMRSRRMVVGRVATKNAHEVPFVQNDDVVEALSPDRSDQTFTIRILPRRGGGCDDFRDAHRLDTPDEVSTEDAVTVAKQIARRGIVRKGFTHLLGGPPG